LKKCAAHLRPASPSVVHDPGPRTPRNIDQVAAERKSARRKVHNRAQSSGKANGANTKQSPRSRIQNKSKTDTRRRRLDLKDDIEDLTVEKQMKTTNTNQKKR
jgi:hypothetical protein